jgi:hypothetical protein
MRYACSGGRSFFVCDLLIEIALAVLDEYQEPFSDREIVNHKREQRSR